MLIVQDSYQMKGHGLVDFWKMVLLILLGILIKILIIIRGGVIGQEQGRKI